MTINKIKALPFAMLILSVLCGCNTQEQDCLLPVKQIPYKFKEFFKERDNDTLRFVSDIKSDTIQVLIRRNNSIIQIPTTLGECERKAEDLFVYYQPLGQNTFCCINFYSVSYKPTGWQLQYTNTITNNVDTITKRNIIIRGRVFNNVWVFERDFIQYDSTASINPRKWKAYDLFNERGLVAFTGKYGESLYTNIKF